MRRVTLCPPEINLELISKSINIGKQVCTSVFDQDYYYKIARGCDFLFYYDIEIENILEDLNQEKVTNFFNEPFLDIIIQNLFSLMPHGLSIQEVFSQFSDFTHSFFSDIQDNSIVVLYRIIISAALKYIGNSDDAQATKAFITFTSKPDYQKYSADPSYLSNYAWNNDNFINTQNEESCFQPLNQKSLPTPGASINQVIQTISAINIPSEFQLIRRNIETFKPYQALELIQNYKKEFWTNLSNLNKAHLLSLEAHANLQQNNPQEASRLFLLSYSYNENDRDFIRKSSLGYFLIMDYDQALEQINKIFDSDKYNQKTYSLYIQIKSKIGSVDEIVSNTPKLFDKSYEVDWAIGLGYLNENRYNDAEIWLRKAIQNSNEKSPFLIQDLAYCLLNQVYSDEKILSGHQLLENHISNLEAAIQLFKDAWDIVEKDELLQKKYYFWLLEMVKALGLISKNEESEQYLSLALSINQKDETSQYFLGLNTFEIGKYNESEVIFKKLIDSSKREGALWMYLKSLEVQKKYDEGLQFITANCLDLSNKEESTLLSFQIIFLLKKGVDYYREALEIAKVGFENHPDNYQYLINYIKILAQCDQKSSCSEILALVSGFKLQNSLSPSEKYELAEILFALNLFSESASLYEEIYVIKENSKIIRRLLISLYNAREYRKTLALINDLHSINSYDILSTELGIRIFHYIGDLQKANDLCSEHLVRNPSDYKILFHLANVSFFQGKYSEVDRILDIEPNISSLNLQENIQLVNLYSYRFKLERALQLAYIIRNEYYDEVEIHEFFVNFFLLKLNGSQIEILNELTTITEDCVVSLKFGDEKDIYNISNLDDRFDYAIKIRPDEFFAKKIIGMQKGALLKIENIINKFHFAFIDSKLKFRTLDSSEISVKEIIFKEIDPDPNKALLQTMKQLVDKRVEGQLQIINSYNRFFLPIGSLIANFHISIFDLLNLFITNKDVSIICSEPDEILYLDEKHLSLIEKPKLIVDIGTLLSLFLLDLPIVFFEKYGKLGIAQSTRDVVLFELCSQPVNEKESISMAYDENGELRNFLHSVEDKRQYKQRLNSILTWIDKNCEILPVNDLLKYSAEFQSRIKNFFDKSYYDTLYLSTDKNAILVSDDLRYRVIAEQEFGTAGVPSQILLLNSYQNQVISEEKYHDSLIFLISSHYSTIFFDGNTLYRSAELVKWDYLFPFSILLQLLSKGQYSDANIVSISFQFIKRICEEKEDEFLVVSLIYLFSHVFIRLNKKWIQNTLLLRIMSDSSLSESKREIIKLYLNSWN